MLAKFYWSSIHRSPYLEGGGINPPPRLATAEKSPGKVGLSISLIFVKFYPVLSEGRGQKKFGKICMKVTLRTFVNMKKFKKVTEMAFDL